MPWNQCRRGPVTERTAEYWRRRTPHQKSAQSRDVMTIRRSTNGIPTDKRYSSAVRTDAQIAAARVRRCRVCATVYDRIAEKVDDGPWRRRSLVNWPTGQPWGLCSIECRRAWEALKARERRARLAPSHTLSCRYCSETFTAKRSDARYCSSRCRVAHHRAMSQVDPLPPAVIPSSPPGASRVVPATAELRPPSASEEPADTSSDQQQHLGGHGASRTLENNYVQVRAL